MSELRCVTKFGVLYAHSFVAKQTDVDGGNVRVILTIPAGSHAEIMSIVIGANDYAAGRDIKAWIWDENSALVKTLMVAAGIDNVKVEGPSLSVMSDDLATGSAASFGTCGLGNPNHRLGGGDVLVFQASALAQNEELTVVLRLWVIGRADQITVATTGSTGTVTLTNTSPFPKVI